MQSVALASLTKFHRGSFARILAPRPRRGDRAGGEYSSAAGPASYVCAARVARKWRRKELKTSNSRPEMAPHQDRQPRAARAQADRAIFGRGFLCFECFKGLRHRFQSTRVRLLHLRSKAAGCGWTTVSAEGHGTPHPCEEGRRRRRSGRVAAAPSTTPVFACYLNQSMSAPVPRCDFSFEDV